MSPSKDPGQGPIVRPASDNPGSAANESGTDPTERKLVESLYAVLRIAKENPELSAEKVREILLSAPEVLGKRVVSGADHPPSGSESASGAPQEDEEKRRWLEEASTKLAVAIVVKPELHGSRDIEQEWTVEPLGVGEAPIFCNWAQFGAGQQARILLDHPDLSGRGLPCRVDQTDLERLLGVDRGFVFLKTALVLGMPEILRALLSLGVRKFEEKENILSLYGDAVSRAVRRELLGEVLESSEWNLAYAAETLGLGNTSNVIRSIKDLGLEAEYEEAKEAGLISRGPRPKKKQSKET